MTNLATSYKRGTAGQLRSRIELQSETVTADGYGGQSRSWITYATVWADLFPTNGSERFQHGKVEDLVTHRCIIRGRTDVQAKHRVKFGTRTFNIRAVLNLNERGAYNELHLEEGVGT